MLSKDIDIVADASPSMRSMPTCFVRSEMSPSEARAKLEAAKHEEVIAWTQSTRFGLAVGAFISLNACTLGFEADYGAEAPTLFFVLENFFTIIFTIELILHLYVEGVLEFFKDKMNWLDFMLVMMSIIDVWIISFLGIQADLRMLSVLRMLRLVRLARLLRLFRIFKELTLLVNGFIDSVKTLFWTMMFLVTVVYAFAIFAHQTIGLSEECGDHEVNCGRPYYEFNEEIGDQASLFGRLDLTMLTLFVCLTEGCGIDIVRPVVRKTPPFIFFWALFIFLTTFGLLNLIVGIFCENATRTADEAEQDLSKALEEEREMRLQTVHKVFNSIDKDDDGFIVADEFHQALTENQEVIDAFCDLGLGDETDLFNTIDAEKQGYLTFEKLYEGVTLIMKGFSHSKHVATLLSSQAGYRASRRIEDQIASLSQDVKAMLGRSSVGTSREELRRVLFAEARTNRDAEEESPEPIFHEPRSKKLSVIEEGSSERRTVIPEDIEELPAIPNEIEPLQGEGTAMMLSLIYEMRKDMGHMANGFNATRKRWAKFEMKERLRRQRVRRARQARRRSNNTNANHASTTKLPIMHRPPVDTLSSSTDSLSNSFISNHADLEMIMVGIERQAMEAEDFAARDIQLAAHKNAKGVWQVVREPLTEGDVVCVREPFLTDDMDVEINLDKGMTGKVMLIDRGGNPQVHFAGLAGVTRPQRWLSKANLPRMLVKRHCCEDFLEQEAFRELRDHETFRRTWERGTMGPEDNGKWPFRKPGISNAGPNRGEHAIGNSLSLNESSASSNPRRYLALS